MNARLHATLDAPLGTPLDVKLMNMATSFMMTAVVLLLVVAFLWWLVRLPLFALAGITVRGDVEHHNAVTVRANVAPRLNGNFFTVDLNHARQVFEGLPWVRHALVQREFPNRLRVVLQAHNPVAYWGAEGEGRLVNSQGEVFEANLGDLEDDELPRLSGPDSQSGDVLAMYLALKEPVRALGSHLMGLDITPRGSWRMTLASGARIELGRGAQTEVLARLDTLVKTLPQVASRLGRKASALEAADLRYDTGYALRMRGVTTVDPQQVKK
jgi:cell division protein FtsQ